MAVFLCSSEGEAFRAEESGFFQEVIVAARVGDDFTGVDVEDAVREFSQEVHVVRDENKCSLVGFEGKNERLDSEDIEMGRGFIHEQQVWGIYQ